MRSYSTDIFSHWFDDPNHIRLREQQWRERDEDQQRERQDGVPALFTDAICYHEAGHCVVATLLGFNIESVRLTSNLSGCTRGVIHDGTGLGAICAMITVAAGKAAQRRFGAKGEFYDRWATDDEKKLIDIAICISSSSRPSDISRVIEAAERVAERMVDERWEEIKTIAQALPRFGGIIERDSIRFFLRNMPHIDVRRAIEPTLRGEATVDGTVFRWRNDGFLRPVRN